MSRIKAPTLGSHGEFLALVNELAQLEIEQRTLAAQRDARLAAIEAEFDAQLAPITEKIKGRVALAAAYAREHRTELLAKDAKSARTTLATYGWRTGNRTVALLGHYTTETVIARLKQTGLGRFIRTREEIARDAILAMSRNGKTVTLHAAAPGRRPRHIALARAGLRITQAETFYVEPHAATAETLKLTAAAA